MNELVKELEEIPVKRRQLEEEAVRHEQAARKCRGEMSDLKVRESELRATVNDAKVVHALESSAKQAHASRQATDAARTEVQAVLTELKAEKDAMVALKEELERRLAELNSDGD